MPRKKHHQTLVAPEKHSVSIDTAQRAFTVPQVAAYSGLTHWQVRMAIWQGKLSAKKVGKSLIILRDDADRFLEGLPTVSANSSAWLARRNRVGVMVRS